MSKYLREDDPPPFGVGDRVRFTRIYDFINGGEGTVMRVRHGEYGWVAEVRWDHPHHHLSRQDDARMAFALELAEPARGFAPGHAADLATAFGL